jgi:hypothetical protein
MTSNIVQWITVAQGREMARLAGTCLHDAPPPAPEPAPPAPEPPAPEPPAPLPPPGATGDARLELVLGSVPVTGFTAVDDAGEIPGVGVVTLVLSGVCSHVAWQDRGGWQRMRES